MIVKKKKSLLMRYLLPLILCVVFVGLIVVGSVLSGIQDETGEEEETPTFEKLEGEGDNQRVLPTLVMSQINRVSVDNLGVKGKYSFMRYGETGEYYLFYDNGSGKEELYLPMISLVDNQFSYSSLLATEAFGDTNISQIYNLTTAVGNIRFSERIPLLPEGEERDEQLKTFGLNEGAHATVTVWYQLDKESESEQYTLYIGSPVVTGTGYYLMVEGRDYIYATATDAIETCMQDYTYFIAARLTAAGLSSDPIYMPYLTPAFKHWRNTWVKEVGKAVTEDAHVVAHGVQIIPAGMDIEDTAGAEDGYILSESRDTSFSLYNLRGSEYARLRAALVGREIGDYTTAPIRFTLTGAGRVISLDATSTSAEYEYRITEVESVLTESGEYESGVVGDANEIKVTYDLYVGGEKKNTVPLHSVIDITESDENPIPKSARDALRLCSLGEELLSPVTFTVTYTKDNTQVRTVEMYLEKILAVYDQNGKTVDTVDENSIVAFRYYYVIDGKAGEMQSMSVNMKAEAEGDSALIREKFLGLTVGEMNEAILLYSQVEYEEVFLDFITYELSEICYFVERECVISFSYLNASERNPFYSDSLYQNFTPGKNSLYSLNAGTCDTIVEILGGMGASTTTTTGLIGNKTVAVGLTPEVMEEYGLYAHTVYYELPRGLITLDSEDDETEDFDWYSQIGFTLYISEEKDGVRYVGCDLYDVVVEIDASNFVFCDYDFVEFWARRQLVLVDVNEIKEFDISFNMKDLSGTLNFDIESETHELSTGGTYQQLKVNLTASDSLNLQVYKDYIARTGGTYVPLDSFYNYVVGGGEEVTYGDDYAGAGYYKEAMQMLFFTTYTDMIDDSDKATVASGEPIMSMRVKIDHDTLPYFFEFYRLDDRRVAVRLYIEWEEGVPAGGNEVSDFYISTYAMKRVANAFLALGEAREFTADDFGYGD